MSCKDCFNNCPEIVSDRCIRYTGEEILGACAGDSLYEVLQTVLTQVNNQASGTGISISGLSVSASCSILSGIGTDKSISNILQVYGDAICALKTSVTTLSAPGAAVSYDTKCLDGLTASSKESDILQSLINKVCTLNTTVGSVPTTYVTKAEVCDLVKNCAAGTTDQIYSKLAPYVAYEYYGPLSNFDASGKGLSAKGYDKLYLCVGQVVNGFQVPDKRGRVAVGATAGMPGAALDAELSGKSWNLRQKFGTTEETLTIAQMPAHTHTATDAGHAHTYFIMGKDLDFDGPAGDDFGASGQTKFSYQTEKGYANITVQSTGGGGAHNNLQPSIAAYYYMYIP